MVNKVRQCYNSASQVAGAKAGSAQPMHAPTLYSHTMATPLTCLMEACNLTLTTRGTLQGCTLADESSKLIEMFSKLA